MAEKVVMIALSPTMDAGTLVKWRKKEGDTVKSGDVICEVETDKATMDYESSSEGVLLKILLPEGGQAKVGDPIAILGKPGEDIAALLAESPPPPAAPKPISAAAARVPAAGLSGQQTAPASAAQIAQTGRTLSSPLARRMARERGIDLRAVPGSGPGGRVVKRDIETASTVASRAAAGLPASPALPAGPSTFAGAAAPVLAPAPQDQVLPLTGMRRTIARRLSESMFTAPHIYLTVSIAMDAIMAARRELNAGRARKVSMNAFLIKLAAEALKRHPRVNSSWNGDSILVRAGIDIGLAVALSDGLITPVVRNCGSKGIGAIDEELSDLVERARAGKLTPEEYNGASFSISNLGSFGVEEFTAVINPPGSAILAVGAIKRQPVVDEEEEPAPPGGRPVAAPDIAGIGGPALTVRSMMRVTLSCDHRVIDGAVGAAFLADLRAMMENPFRILY
jgi:pyruvate dehydrogenase E2 component (dihydrolipoamide acetyltransferase)